MKGIAHIGALITLEQHGYQFHRMAGASAGAIAAAVVAACAAKGDTVASVRDLMWPGRTDKSIQYQRVPGGNLGIPGVDILREAFSFATHEGLFDTKYLHEWVRTTLKDMGVETFADLRLDDPGRTDLANRQQYRLVVMVTDISRGALVRLPWDYDLYGLKADDQLVADAVVASAAIPFFFTPQKLPWGAPSTNVSYLMDGGACSDFPIEIFDTTGGVEPRWPTFGVKLSARPREGQLLNRVSNIFDLSSSLLETVVNGNDQVHLADPGVQARTIFVDTAQVPSADFGLGPNEIQLLYNNGVKAAADFLDARSWESYDRSRIDDPSHDARVHAASGWRDGEPVAAATTQVTP